MRLLWRRVPVGSCLAFVAVIAWAALWAREPGHAEPPSSCADAGVTFETATSTRTDYTFAAAGHVVEAEGVAWLGLEGHALELLGVAGGCWRGGRIDGPYDERSVYECSRTHCPSGGCPTPCLAYHTTACIAPESLGGQVIEGVECAHYGDGISREATSGDVVVRRAHLHDLNDDAIEDDYGLSSTRVFDSLIDGVHLAFGDRQRSSQNNDARGTEWEVRGSLVRIRPNANSYTQRPGHGGFWKGDHDPSHQHRYRITNNVFVAQGVKEGGLLFPVVGYVDECAGNVLLWAGPRTGSGGYEAALADANDFADGCTDGERLAALDAAFPDCFRVVVKPDAQTEAEFLAAPLDALGGRSWQQLVAEWGGANAAPVVVIAAPADGANVPTGEPLAFEASASDAEDGDLSAAIAWSSSVAGPLGSGPSLVVGDLPVGEQLVRAAVSDSGGRAGSDAVTVTVAGPNTAPSLVITAPADGTTRAVGEAVVFTATASDAEDGDLAAAIAWGSSLVGPLGSGAALTLGNLAAGTHLVTASVTDAGGLAAGASVSVRMSNRPVVRITAPPNGVSVKAGAPVAFAGSASDVEDGNLSPALVWTSSRDGVLGAGASLVKSLRAKGTHAITASVTDAAGLVAQAQIQVRVR